VKKIILLCHPDYAIRNKIAVFLEKNGYDVISVQSKQELIKTVEKYMPDVVICDIVFRDSDGFAVIQELRASTSAAIIAIGQSGAEEDKVKALDSGADDYAVRPFMKQEFLARIRALIRRSTINSMRENGYHEGELEIDFIGRTVKKGGREIHLTPIEYRLIELLGSQRGCVLTYEYLLGRIWGPFAPADNKILRVNMTNIRKKIETDTKNPQYIFTENGIGYKMK